MTELKPYQICTKCIMDTSTQLISFDSAGVCSYCHQYDRLTAQTVNQERSLRYKDFEQLVQQIKKESSGQKYDCLLGLSGGVDSSYMALIAKDYGLNPLVVHFDNGWDTQQAVNNIEGVLKYTGFDLYSYVINWDEFKDLQLAYIKASVLDIEVPTDQLIFASLFSIAKAHKIKNILSGNNIRTEGILPEDWCYPNKNDYYNLLNIHKKFGQKELVNFPRLGLKDRERYKREGYKLVTILDKVDFELKHVIERLKNDAGFIPFPGKHHESIFTRFYQGYILPRKFGIDKRRAHLASLIVSGQLEREVALEEMNKPTYDEVEMKADYAFVLKKFDFTETEFEKIMSEPPIPHAFYGDDYTERINYDFVYRLKMIWKYKVMSLFK